MIARKDTGEFFDLTALEPQLANYPFVNTSPLFPVQDITFSATKGYKSTADDNRKFFKIFREYAKDNGNLAYYRLQNPIILDWRFYQPLPVTTVTPNPTDAFYTPSGPFNGINSNWAKYGIPADWSINFRTEVNVKQGQLQLSYSNETPFDITEYDLGSDWDTETITAFDSQGTPLGTTYNTANDTLIRAEFHWVGAGSAPTSGEVTIVLNTYSIPQGSPQNSQKISSTHDMTPSQGAAQWQSIDNSNLTVVTVEAGDILRGEAIIKANAFTEGQDMFVSARIYDNRGIPATGNGKLSENAIR